MVHPQQTPIPLGVFESPCERRSGRRRPVVTLLGEPPPPVGSLTWRSSYVVRRRCRSRSRHALGARVEAGSSSVMSQPNRANRRPGPRPILTCARRSRHGGCITCWHDGVAANPPDEHLQDTVAAAMWQPVRTSRRADQDRVEWVRVAGNATRGPGVAPGGATHQRRGADDVTHFPEVTVCTATASGARRSRPARLVATSRSD